MAVDYWFVLLLGAVVGFSVGTFFQLFSRWVDSPAPAFQCRDGRSKEIDGYTVVKCRLLNVGDGVARDFLAYAPQGYLLMWDEGVEPDYDDALGTVPRNDRRVTGGPVESVPALRDGDFRWLTFVASTSVIDDRVVRLQWRERKRWGRGWEVKDGSFPVRDMMMPPM